MNVLIIDDCAALVQPYVEVFKDEYLPQITFLYAENRKDGLAALEREPVGLVLMDGHLVNDMGHSVVAEMREKGIGTPVCMFSSDEKANRLGKEAGAEFSVNKGKFMKNDFKAMNDLAAIIQLAIIRDSTNTPE